MKYQIINGDNRTALKQFPDNHFDSIVTDPPYGIDFLGKSWDANTGALETYQECLRVLKPGGHILAFSAARTYHHLAITLEQAGFEIRDQIMWIYSSGFPKSQDVGKSIERSEKKRVNAKAGGKTFEGSKHSTCGTCGKNNVIIGSQFSCDKEICDMRERLKPADNAWAGWGTALKPAHEPIALARKPIKGSIKDNVLKHGVGALNIDATRVPYESEEDKNAIDHKVPTAAWSGHTIQVDSYEKGEFVKVETNDLGRFPSNVLGEIPDYQKYFYCPKVSRRERNVGCIDPGPQFQVPSGFDYRMPSSNNANNGESQIGIVEKNANNGSNNHPTVKPIELMKYLIKLVTPKGGRVLDPFNGSGSTGCAAVGLGCEYVGIELDAKYVEIATKRIEAWNKEETSFKELFS
jgi:site-specific DNA-methyltransferase (adenine-specific)